MQVVPATTRIRTRSMQHVETERLLARLDYLRANWGELCRGFEQKSDLRARVREIVNIERTLNVRGVPFRLLSNGSMMIARAA